MSRMPRWVWNIVAYLPAVTATPAFALGIAGLTKRGPRILSDRPLLAGLVTVGASLALVRWQLQRLFTEQPDYEVERKIGDLEIRRYGSRVVAETTVDIADEDEARQEGFRRLAGYIFGGNRDDEKIAMTAPVTTRATHVTASGNGHVVTFMMPKDCELASLPRPKDDRVHLRVVRGERVAALRYHGPYQTELTKKKHAELLARVREAGLVPVAEPVFAGYDAPSTLPLLRRVEAWVPIAS